MRVPLTELTEAEWRPLAERHAARVSAWIDPHLERRLGGRRGQLADDEGHWPRPYQ